MYSITHIIFVFLTFFAFVNVANADELWLHSEKNVRTYFTTEQTESGFQLKKYRQEKGDYQDLISTQHFRNAEEISNYIKTSHPGFAKTEKLISWPVDTAYSEKKNSNIWIARNSWSEQWEKQYALWLSKEIHSEFFKQYNFAVDCADATVAFRWIFSRIHSLPVANNVSDTGSLFGNFSMRKTWQNFPTAANWYDDRLFMAALNYVVNLTSTKTVKVADTFPVAITKRGLSSGTFIITRTSTSGHLRTITENHFDDRTTFPLFTSSATSPREIRSLYREAFVDQKWPTRGEKELLAFRWPMVSGSSWTLTPKRNHVNYSEEQFNYKEHQKKYISFIQFVLARVKPDYDPFNLIDTGVEDIVNYTEQRIKIVRDGYEYCRSHNCQVGTQGWEDWSTPNRDAKYLAKFIEVEELVKSFDPMYPGMLKRWVSSLDETEMYVEGHYLNLTKLRYLFEKKLTSYNPHDPILRRWGLTEKWRRE